jgi:hypothetical protein
MSATLGWQGLSELARDMAALPETVRAKFKPVMERAGQQIVSETTAAYATAGVPSLAEGMRVESSGDASDLSVRIKLTSPVAHLRELGTVDRYTSSGAYRGRQPARPVFIPTVERVRGEVAETLSEAIRDLGGPRLRR